MERRAAVIVLVAGLIAWAVTALSFFVEIGRDHDVAEGIGLLAFVAGLFLVWEGGFGLVQSRTSVPRDKSD